VPAFRKVNGISIEAQYLRDGDLKPVGAYIGWLPKRQLSATSKEHFACVMTQEAPLVVGVVH